MTKPGQKSAGGRNFSEAALESSLGHVLHEFLFLQSVFLGSLQIMEVVSMISVVD